MTIATTSLKPRRTPVQARSAATIEVLHSATIQVLTRAGLARCTTTRIAERAGISVGSLYQYYPNRDALLVAVLEKHLTSVALAIEKVCERCRNVPLEQMASALVAAFVAGKLRDIAESKALYAVAEGRGGARIAARMRARMAAAVAELIVTAPDARFENPLLTSTIALAALAGPTRTLLEGRMPAGFEAHLETELARLLTAYLEAARIRLA